MTFWKQYDSISMSGCGMLNFYQVGVYKALYELGIPSDIRFAGASAGSLYECIDGTRYRTR